MTIDTKDNVQFDPGFIQHMSAFEPNIEYVYSSLNSCRNFNQKKMQFKMFYPKIQSLLKNYLGFYLGCILWAVYIKSLGEKPITGNLCLKTPSKDDLQEILAGIEKVIENGKLHELFTLAEKVL